MLTLATLCGCLLALILAGTRERWMTGRARAAIPIRIHVNGTRGKSTVTRLIHAALQQAGISALAKTTGTAARLLLPDGTEQPLARRGRPNIREQIRLLKLAHTLGVQAVVAECMAIDPALQWVSEKDILQSTIGVITNVRTDHTEVMGRTPVEVARSLANAIPRNGILVLGTTTYGPLLRNIAKNLNTRVVDGLLYPPTKEHSQDCQRVDPAFSRGAKDCTPAWLQQSRTIALAVTRELGIPDTTALLGMEGYRPDPGTAQHGTLRFAGRGTPYLDARAANDPESLQQILEAFFKDFPEHAPKAGNPWILLYNHRADRPERLRSFLKSGFFLNRDLHFLISGDLPCRTLQWETTKALGKTSGSFIHRARLARHLEELSFVPGGIVFCGNARGLDPHTLWESAP
jgi:gamma-polyglutamate synthase